MNIISLICIATAAVLLVLTLKDRPEIGLVIAIATGVVIIAGSAGWIEDIFETIKNISVLAGIEGENIKIIFKVSGIALAITICSAICKDAGQSAIAAKVEIAGRAAIIATAVPVINNLFRVIVKVIQ